jgi:hypothetical protein
MNNAGTAVDFYVFDLNGNLVRSAQLVRNGPSAVLQYPYLAMNGPTLYVAWTSYQMTMSLNWDSHFIRSDDGGDTWRKPSTGGLLPLPVTADQTGSADSLVLSDEYGFHVWLANMLAQGSYIHFMYEAQLPVPREHYLRFNSRTRSLDVNIYPRWGGKDLAIRNLDGFFAADTGSSRGLLYVVSTDKADSAHRIVVLASADSGRTWFDYAVSRPFSRPYSIGGARLATAGGRIIGTFTDLIQPDSGAAANVNEVWFFRVDAR